MKMNYLQVDRDYVNRIELPVSDEAISVGHSGIVYQLLKIYNVTPAYHAENPLPDFGNSLVERIEKAEQTAQPIHNNPIPNLANCLEE